MPGVDEALATLNRPVLGTVDVETKEATVSFKERTDVTAVPAMGVVAETMVALVLAGEALRKFGGDSLPEVLRNGRLRREPARWVTRTVERDGERACRRLGSEVVADVQVDVGPLPRR